MVDNVASITHLDWNKVMEMLIIEFLNINCYIRDKNEYEKQQMEKWKRTH